MYNRELLSLLVEAANYALTAPLTGGKLVKNLRPGIISLIQTHSDSMEFNPHLHMVVTDGLVDYSDISYPQFKPVMRWDGAVITEIFRWRLLKLLVKKHVITPELADNMLSWPHSGFHAHATAPFGPDNAELVTNRLAYAFRPAVALNRLLFDDKTVTLTTAKRNQLALSPLDFLAKLTLHIPDRYQNIRRYAGFYSPNIQSRVSHAKTNADSAQAPIEESKPVPPKWAAMIALIFGELPVSCPKCGAVMELREFVFNDAIILEFFPFASRAPPGKIFEDYIPDDSGVRYIRNEETVTDNIDFNQVNPESEAYFNQEITW